MKKFFSLMIMVLTLMSAVLVGCQDPVNTQNPGQTQTSESLSSILPNTVWYRASNNTDGDFYNAWLTFSNGTGELSWSEGTTLVGSVGFTYTTWYDNEAYLYKVKVSFASNSYAIFNYDTSLTYESLTIDGANNIGYLDPKLGTFTKQN